MKEIIDGQEIEYEVGSGNIFEDLGVKNPQESLAKAEIASAIQRIINTHSYTQTEAAKIVGLTQPKMNDVLRGRLGGYSVERLLHMVTLLGYDVEVKISKRRQSSAPGMLRVKAA